MPPDKNDTIQKTDADDLNLPALWAEFLALIGYASRARPRTSASSSWRQGMFREHLRKITSNPDDIGNFGFCGDCGDPAWDDRLSSAGDNRQVCEQCWGERSDCDSCDQRFRISDLSTLLNGARVCENCRDNDCSYCEDCEGYYFDLDSADHDHEDTGSCCSAPQQEFTIRNDSCEPLENDTLITVTLPSGVISPEGITEIRQYLRSASRANGDSLYTLAHELDGMDPRWQAESGNFTKRLSHLAYKTYSIKIPPAILSQVGCLARDHSRQVDVILDVTRDLNQSATAFGNDGSCWWGSYSESRCALKTNGGFGLRSYDAEDDVSGRAWVMPLRLRDKRLVPTFNTLTPDAFVLFNGYGDLSGYAAARIMAHLSGWTYRKIAFACSPMYVNGNSGYLVAPEPITALYASAELRLSVSRHATLSESEKEEAVHA